MEYARARAPAAGQPGRHQPRRARRCSPTAPTSRRRAGCRRSSTPSEIWCQLFSEPDAGSDLASLDHPGRARRRRLAAQRPEGVDVATPSSPGGGSAWPAPTPTPPKHRGISYLVVDMDAPRHRDPAARADHRRGRVQRGVPRRGVRARRPPRRRARTRAGRWPTRRWPTSGARVPVQGAGRPRGVPRRALRRWPPRDGRLDDVEVADGLAQAFVELRVLRLHNWRTLSRLGRGDRAGPRVELGEAGLDRHDPAPVRRSRCDVVGPEAAPIDEGPWQRQWLWSKAASIAGGTTEVQSTIIGERILGLPRADRPGTKRGNDGGGERSISRAVATLVLAADLGAIAPNQPPERGRGRTGPFRHAGRIQAPPVVAVGWPGPKPGSVRPARWRLRRRRRRRCRW